MIRRPPRSTLDRSSAASDVYKRQDVVYVRPVYVIATGTDATQQLVEVLAYTDGLVGRGATLDEALNNLREPISAVPETPEVLATPSG
mgnify:CR=1 FL=1